MLSHATGIGSNVKPSCPMLGLTICLAGFLLTASLAPLAPQAAAATNGQAVGADAASKLTLPAGTRIMVTMVDAVDSDRSQPDQRFRGTLAANLMAGDTLVAPKGTTVFGRLITAQSSGARSGGQLEFDLTDIMVNGQMFSLATSSNQLEGQSGSNQSGTGAKVGAAAGALAGGIGGAIGGAGIGAIAGKASSGNTHGEKVKVPAGALVEFTLEHPVSLPVTGK
jgi:hypothetical protein